MKKSTMRIMLAVLAKEHNLEKLIKAAKANISKRTSLDVNTVENLLFELTENEQLTSSEFKTFFEQLSDLKERMDLDTLSIIYSKLKEYGRKA